MGETSVSLTFTNSNAGGALLSFIAITDDEVNFTTSALVSVNKEISHNYTLPFSLSPGRYRVFVYDIKHDGTLPSDVNYPAVTRDIYDENFMGSEDLLVRSFQPTFIHIKNCTVETSYLFIDARCDYLTNSTATGFQMIVRQSDPNNVRKLFVNITEELDAEASVEVEENGTYQVAIFAVMQESGITESDVEYIKRVEVCTCAGILIVEPPWKTIIRRIGNTPLPTQFQPFFVLCCSPSKIY